jgi:O-methyltransferase
MTFPVMDASAAVSSQVSPAALYLDLLKATLTNTLFQPEPDADDENQLRYVDAFIRHYMEGTAISMCPLGRFQNVQYCIEDVLRHSVPGDLIETGVWRGGMTIFMRAVLKAYGVEDRTVWVADSFEGLPAPDADKCPLEAQVHNGKVMKTVYNHFAVGIEEVRRNFQAFGLLDDRVCFLKGWFRDTLPSAPISKLAIVRLDGDYYDSTRDSLTCLYPKLSIGGYVIIDDYGEDTWTYCRKAVDEFRQEHGIKDLLVRVDSKCYFWQRTQ